MGKFSKQQLDIMRKAYGTLSGMNPSSPTYKKFIKFLDKLPKDQLKQLANAKIKFVSMLAKNRLRGESVNEASLPSNIQRWISARGPKPAKDVKIINKWVKKLTGRGIVAGVSIGKNYDTLVLDIEYQDAAIHYDTTSGEIKLYKKKIRNFNDFKKVFQANESVDEAQMATRATLKQLGSELNKASDVIIKITDKYKKKADVDGMVSIWMRGLHLRLKKSGVKI